MKMGNHGVEHINTSRNDAVECSGTTIEIIIKTLDSQTFTLRVDKCVIVLFISLPILYYLKLPT